MSMLPGTTTTWRAPGVWDGAGWVSVIRRPMLRARGVSPTNALPSAGTGSTLTGG